MAKVLVLYHSFYGHVEAMANAVDLSLLVPARQLAAS